MSAALRLLSLGGVFAVALYVAPRTTLALLLAAAILEASELTCRYWDPRKVLLDRRRNANGIVGLVALAAAVVSGWPALLSGMLLLAAAAFPFPAGLDATASASHVQRRRAFGSQLGIASAALAAVWLLSRPH